MNTLTKIQSELKAPKNRKNKFGGYNYRSCEDILEAVKPLLVKYEASLTIWDDIVEVGGRVYVKATAYFTCSEFQTQVTAFAREAESKKGMDDSQITGTASSYARKYALNGLFLIDDTKDADTEEYANQTKEAEEREKVSVMKIGTVKGTALSKMLTDAGQNVEAILNYYGVAKAEDLTEAQHLTIVNSLQSHLKEKEKNGSKGKD